MTATPPLPLRHIVPLVAILFIASAVTALAQKPLRVKTTGKVTGVAPGSIFMIEDGGKSYTIKVPAMQNVVHVTGTLPVEKLQAGMIVRFTGKLKGSSVDGEISALKVFTRNDGYQLGLIQDDPSQDATVTGQLTKANNGILAIAAGRTRITGKLADDAKIEIDSKDYSIAKAGDRIEADGTVGKDGSVSARKVVITIGGPPADAEKKPAKKKK